MAPNRKVVTAAEMQSIEQRWFESGEITLEGMMDRVGRAIADWVLADLGQDARDKRVLALVGKGNNGGDALIAGKYLLEAGIETTVGLILPRDGDDPPMTQFVEAGGNVVDLRGAGFGHMLSNLCDKNELILDGVFGFSISRPIEEPISSVFAAAKSSGTQIVAIDMPSGANPDTGEFDPNGLPADECLPVGLAKLGPAIRFGDPAYGDEMTVLDVGIPSRFTDHIKREVNTTELARTLLPDRDQTAHKGDFGRALLVAGSMTYVGAASLAARARYSKKRVPSLGRRHPRSDIHSARRRRQRRFTRSRVCPTARTRTDDGLRSHRCRDQSFAWRSRAGLSVDLDAPSVGRLHRDYRR